MWIFAWLIALHAQESDVARLERRVSNLERTWASARPDAEVTRLGPVASKIYADPSLGPVVGLSAEVFTLTQGGATTTSDPASTHTNVLDVRPLFAYRLHPRLLFNAQLSFDTGGAEASETVTLRKGQAIVRFAYLDWFFDARGNGGVRLGHQLVPVGLTNPSAEALTYFGVARPLLERTILPADWHENGALAWYEAGGRSVQAGVFTAPNARGFRGETFLVGGVSQGQNAPSSDWMGVAAADVRERGWQVGASVAAGRTAQGNQAILNGTMVLTEAHARYRENRAEFGGQLGLGSLADADVISSLNETNLPARARGAAAWAAYECLGEGEPKLWAFARRSTTDWFGGESTVGASYLPLKTVVLKGDVTRTDGGPLAFALGAGLIY